MYNVKTRKEAEEFMNSKGFSYEWNDDNGNLKLTTSKLDGVLTGSNGSKVFFNSIVAAFCTNVDEYNEYGKSVIFGDGSLLSSEIVEDLRSWMHENKCAYKWNPG